MRIRLINGPNLNLLGTREPQLYGRATLADIEAAARARAGRAGAEVECFQSNHEGELVSRVQEARGHADGIILNPAGYGPGSVALLDALLAVDLPAIEVHLTNLARREAFRRRSLTAAACIGTIAGFGAYGYELAVDALLQHLGAAEPARGAPEMP